MACPNTLKQIHIIDDAQHRLDYIITGGTNVLALSQLQRHVPGNKLWSVPESLTNQRQRKVWRSEPIAINLKQIADWRLWMITELWFAADCATSQQITIGISSDRRRGLLCDYVLG